MRRSGKPPSVRAPPGGQVRSNPNRPQEASQAPPAGPRVGGYPSLGQFLGPPTPHLPPHPAAPGGTRGPEGGAAPSGDSARRPEFLAGNVRNAASAGVMDQRGAGAGRGRARGDRGRAAVQAPGSSLTSPPPAPAAAATPRSQPPREHKAERGPRPPPRARPRPGAGSRQGSPLRSFAPGARAAAGGTAGRKDGRRAATHRPRPAALRTPAARLSGPHRGGSSGPGRPPPAEPQGCSGWRWRRFPLFLSARRRRRRLLGKRKKKSPGQQLLESLC